MPLDNVRIVLIDTQHPGNIGAVARAMKAMALRQLYLVRPARYPSLDAERRAAGAADALAKAIVLDDLDGAIGDCRLVVGGSARARTHPLPVLDARACGIQLVDEARRGHPVAVLFGPERSGLSNEHLNRCNFQVRIPTNPEFSSLNLASAVQLVCYEILMAARAGLPAPDPREHLEFPGQREMEFFFRHLERTLDARDFTADSRRDATFFKLRRLFGRARPERGELKLLHSLVRLMKRDDEGGDSP